MNKKLGIAGSLFGLTAVMIGAFGAHGLEDSIDASSLATFETGVKYQMYHALLLLLVSLFALSEHTKRTLLILFICGIVLFSGSIYGLATNVLTAFDFSKIALLTPLGGLFLILGWVVLLIQFIKYHR
ncbi:MAG: uncharacterized membrane protein YgdD (TMEM256/DUF423 family) [Flavobacteriales bacterium]|jgi:uncharacterized membrane protein YgdD (TMEM256/DUF423 family)